MTKKFALQFLSVFALTLTAAAQSDSLRALYQSSATIKTNIEGVRAYPVPPTGFNPIAASDEELAAYGIPLRPDKVRDPDKYSQWTRVAKLAADPRKRWYGELKPRTVHSTLPVVTPTEAAGSGTEFTATSVSGKGWSGAVNTLPLTAWSSTESFSYVQGWFNVPQPQEAFAAGGGNICDGETDQASFWVGLGGLTVTGKKLGNQNNLAQSGVDILAACSDGSAYAWVEWYPGPSVQLFGVSAGDDILVTVQANSATSASFFILDLTGQQTAGYVFDAPSGFQLVGNEADFIVERPGGNGCATCLYPLANYIWSFWDFAHATTFSKVDYYPASNSSAAYRLSMTDDAGDQVISLPNFDKGGQNLFVSTQNCAFDGGCTP